MQHLEDYIPFTGYEIMDDIGQINESAQSEVANSKGTILAIVKGQHFCPGKVSRNHRLYTEALWKAAAKDEEVKRKLANNQMIGRVGHEAEMTDEDIAEGKFSHYTRNIDWDTGMAESVILDTKMGKNLYTLLKSGVTMYVSSRADGDYNGKDEEGNDILDPGTYKLERFDFVQDPGFLEAKPKMITESKVKESASESVAKSLLSLAKSVGAPLDLDGQTYTVDDASENAVTLTEVSEGKSDTYTYNDFTEVTADISESLVKHFESIKKDLSDSDDLVKMLRHANKEGLDEAYVSKKVSEGKALEDVHRARPQGPTFKVVEAVTPKSEDTFLDRLFGGR